MRMIIPTGRRSRSAVIVGPVGAFFYGIMALFGWTIWACFAVFWIFYKLGVLIDTILRARKGLPPR